MKKTIDLDAVRIFDGSTVYFGADRRWFPNKLHGLFGGGPATAALITKYMAQVFPDACKEMYPYSLPAQKANFIRHMIEIREFVNPGLRGIRSTMNFASGTVAYAKSRGVSIEPQVVSRKLNMRNAFGFVEKAVEEGYMPAMLILKNPSRAITDFCWRWMSITGCDDDTKSVFVSTNGKEFELPFDLVWQQHKSYEAGIVYFYSY